MSKGSRFPQATWNTAIWWMAVVFITTITAIYRWYQPLTHPALLQFDIFDWARQSREYFVYGHLLTQTFLWVFPVWNALVSKLTGVDLFNVYLYSGAALTTLNLVFFLAIGRLLWPKNLFLQLVPSVYYAFNYQLLARSVNYLPETMSYTFGLALVYLYLILMMKRKWWPVIPIVVVTYLYYHLHQSGLNFLIFTAAVLVAYVLFRLPLTRRWRLIIFSGGLGLAMIIVALNGPLRQQFLFFIKGNPNDIAFQGTAIPVNQLYIDYPIVFYIPLLIGAAAIIINWFKRRDLGEKLGWAVLFGITVFYYGFLYIFPNLHLYSLVPWRFYTWFSLYAIFIAARGIETIFNATQSNRLGTGVAMATILLNLFHVNLISDNMFTADAATVHSLEQIPLASGSISFTTNANYLQTLYALVGKPVKLYQAGAEVFYSPSAEDAWQILRTKYPTNNISYVIISKFQLRQRPYSIDYWRNNAYYDMHVGIFRNQKYFKNIYEDNNVVAYSVVANAPINP